MTHRRHNAKTAPVAWSKKIDSRCVAQRNQRSLLIGRATRECFANQPKWRTGCIRYSGSFYWSLKISDHWSCLIDFEENRTTKFNGIFVWQQGCLIDHLLSERLHGQLEEWSFIILINFLFGFHECRRKLVLTYHPPSSHRVFNFVG